MLLKLFICLYMSWLQVLCQIYVLWIFSLSVHSLLILLTMCFDELVYLCTPAVHTYLKLDNIYYMKELNFVPPSLLPFLSLTTLSGYLCGRHSFLFAENRRVKLPNFMKLHFSLNVGRGERHKKKWISKKIWNDYRHWNIKMCCMHNEKVMVKTLFQVGGSEIRDDI